MKALWKGAISFGLVTIPVSLYPATRREELKFRLLRKSDQSTVNYKRIAEAEGNEVPWDQIVKGYEYEKGKFVIIKDEDFARVDVVLRHLHLCFCDRFFHWFLKFGSVEKFFQKMHQFEHEPLFLRFVVISRWWTKSSITAST